MTYQRDFMQKLRVGVVGLGAMPESTSKALLAFLPA